MEISHRELPMNARKDFFIGFTAIHDGQTRNSFNPFHQHPQNHSNSWYFGIKIQNGYAMFYTNLPKILKNITYKLDVHKIQNFGIGINEKGFFVAFEGKFSDTPTLEQNCTIKDLFFNFENHKEFSWTPIGIFFLIFIRYLFSNYKRDCFI